MNAHRNKGFKSVSSEEFAGIIGDTAIVQLLDVRTKEEYEEGHIAVTVKGETPLIDKLAPFLTAAQLYSPQAFENKKESGAFWF